MKSKKQCDQAGRLRCDLDHRAPDIDLEAGTVRVRAALVERSTGEILLGPPKSRAGRRVVGIPQVIIPVLREHLSLYAKDEPGAPAFPGAQGGPLHRGNFNKMSAWPYAVRSIGAEGLHFHDLRQLPGKGNRPHPGDRRCPARKLLKRVTRIELAPSAWKAQRLRPPGALTGQVGWPLVAVTDPSSPWLMAR
jgi:hypothetical protein